MTRVDVIPHSSAQTRCRRWASARAPTTVRDPERCVNRAAGRASDCLQLQPESGVDQHPHLMGRFAVTSLSGGTNPCGQVHPVLHDPDR